jgi:MATE family multidrug resistance protein
MVALAAAILANLFNIAGNYALIFGHWGFAPHGVAGAAWSTQISGLIQALIMLGWMLFPWYRREFHTLRTWRPNLARMRELLWLGAPAGFQFAADIVSFTIFTVAFVGRFGTVQLAAHNLAFKFLELSFMPTVGLGAAVTASVGKAIGAGSPQRARRIVRWGTFFGMSYMGLIALGFVLIFCLVHAFGPGSFHSWLSDDNDVIRWASRLLLFCAVFQIFDALNIINVSALRGAGDNHVPAIISTTMSLTFFLPGAYLMSHLLPQWQIAGPWTAATVYICVMGVVFWARWNFGPWEKIKLHPADLEAALAEAESVPLP